MIKTDILSFYTFQSPITDPGEYAFMYADLPDQIPDLVQVIQGILLHRNSAPYYNLQLTSQQRKDIYLRTMAQRLGRIHELDPAPLTLSRTPNDRQVGLCRDFAVFLVSFLRHKGIPARMRVGFLDYFKDTPYKSDHWITEYWDKGRDRWVLVDPDIGGMPAGAFECTVDLFDIQRDRDFYIAGSAWQLARAGKIKSTFFRYNGKWKGFPCIRGNMLHDFQALNKLELRIFDYFDDLSTQQEHKLTVDDKALLDQIASLTAEPDQCFEDIQTLFNELPRTRQIITKLQTLGVLPAPVSLDVDDLQPSGAARLAAQTIQHHPNGGKTFDFRRFRLDGNDAFDDPLELPFPQGVTSQDAVGMGDIVIRGARQHNLKNIDIVIPRHKLVVVTGVSGSGKSSLAFDTLYAEGQRRYVESLSSYARQFMGQMEKPQVDQITGLSPAIAIEQKTVSRNPRSTVGTVTEILDYLRVLYARVGVPHCPQCGRAVEPQSAQQIGEQLAMLPAETRFQILAPVIRNRKGTHARLLKQALKEGYTRARVNSEQVDLTLGIPELDKQKKHNIELIVDRLVIPEKVDVDFRTRLMDSVETSLRAAGGVVLIVMENDEIILSEHHACPVCEISFPELQPNLFSFNSPLGMCEACNGLGVQLQVDPDLIVTKPHISLLDGASPWYGNVRKKGRWTAHSLASLAEHYKVDLELPWSELPEQFRQVLLFGSGGEKIHFEYDSGDGRWRGESYRETQGIVYHINRLFRQTKSEGTRRYYMSFMSKQPCQACQGERLCKEARFVTVAGKRLPELTSWSIESIHDWVSDLIPRLTREQREIGGELIEEIRQRLGFIRNVGLHYLTLDRPAPTLSGGEGQRIRLASQIGSGLVGVMYILDEPSIGLHTRDHRALLDTLTHLRDTGNTVLVVEHDADTMRTADWLIDLGPGPGMLGGELVAAGTPEEVMANPDSLTGRYLSGSLQVTAPNGRVRRQPTGWLTLQRARLHNLRDINVKFPLGTLVCVTGVSGSGKSSLIAQTLHPALARTLHNAQTPPGPHDGIDGLDQVDKVINITQDPIGRNPRSNPGTYAGVMTEIRKVFAAMPSAKALGYQAGRFSFNVKGGRCETCKGYGYKKVEMHFLADVWVKCQACGGKRFNRETLAITYKEKNIADVMDMDVQEALSFFENHPSIARILQTLHDVGLDYMKLGQSALTLSGGEAQRVKLAKELSRVATGRTVYFLDEPTTGLHFADIQRLLDVLHRLVDAGNTVIVIEHNLDVIKSADWIIDLGPEGGEKGGEIVVEGPPEVVAAERESYTGRFLKEMLERKEKLHSNQF